MRLDRSGGAVRTVLGILASAIAETRVPKAEHTQLKQPARRTAVRVRRG